jgi:hypothetical protein
LLISFSLSGVVGRSSVDNGLEALAILIIEVQAILDFLHRLLKYSKYTTQQLFYFLYFSLARLIVSSITVSTSSILPSIPPSTSCILTLMAKIVPSI